MITVPTLYDHQNEQIQRLRQTFAKHDSAILCARAGGGKTRMSKWMIGSCINRDVDRTSGRCLFVVYGRNLVDNASDSFNEEPALPHGLIMSGSETDWQPKVSIGSIDTLLSWYVEDGTYRGDLTFDFIVYDESHAHLQKFHRFVKAHNERRNELGLRQTKWLGLTATPDHKNQADVFQAIVNGPKTEWMIDNGYLAPFEYFHATQGKLGTLIKKGSTYTEESVSNAMAGLSGDLVRDWKQYGQGRPTVGFFPRRSHAQEARNLLAENGVNAEYVDGETSDDQRRQLFRQLGDGTIDYLCNVGVVERGTNIPAISCIQLCTVVRKRSRLEQMLGRGSRTTPGKDCCRVIDHGSNIHGKPDSLGFFEDDVEWSLDASNGTNDTEGTRPTIKCPQCQRVYRGGLCTACGYKPEPKELKSQGLEFKAGKMVKLDRKKVKPSKEAKPKSNEQIMVSALYQAGKHNGSWKQAYAIACGIATKQGGKFRPPASFQISGKTYKPVSYGSTDGVRRVRELYDFVGRKYE